MSPSVSSVPVVPASDRTGEHRCITMLAEEAMACLPHGPGKIGEGPSP